MYLNWFLVLFPSSYLNCLELFLILFNISSEFKDGNMLYKMQGSQPIFTNPISLEDVDNLWIKKLSKEDKKIIEKDLKKFKKI